VIRVLTHTYQGAAPDGKYYNMRALDITQFTAPIDRLFGFCRDSKHMGTTGIGDGGNEIGTRVAHIRQHARDNTNSYLVRSSQAWAR
jgi:hypothetical protein